MVSRFPAVHTQTSAYTAVSANTGTSPKPVIMSESIKRAFSRTTLSNLVWFAVLVAVGFAVGSTTARSDTAATCPPCYSAQHTDENFDNVTPPALPTGWLATNTLGPPPFRRNALQQFAY